MAGLLTLAALGGGCGGTGGSEALGPEDWVNPDVGRVGEPLEVQAAQLPYEGEITEGIHYLKIVGLPEDLPRSVTLLGMAADADLFVLGDSTFSSFQCGSVKGAAADEQCMTDAMPGDVLYVEVYGYSGNETTFVLDVL